MASRATDYYLKPMNCPMHNLIFRPRGRSYRELPLRLFEFGTVYRYEKSGVVHGLTRVRGLTQDDAHILRTPEHGRRGARLLRFVLGLLRDYGLTDFYLELSTRDDSATSSSATTRTGRGDRGAARGRRGVRARARAGPGRRGVLRAEDLGPGPGRDRPHLADVDDPGATSTCPSASTLEYQAADGTRQRPVMIHRALFGSIERFFGVLLEHYAGAFPAWLAPVQVVGIPVTATTTATCRTSLPGCGRRASGSRSTPPTTGCRRRSATRRSRRCRSCCIAGEDDVSKGAVSFRCATASQDNGVPVDEAVARIVAAVREPRVSGGRRGGTHEQRGAGLQDAFARLYTPHRMAYIRGEGKPPATAARSARSRRCRTRTGLIVARGEVAYAVLNLYPYNSGHVMLVPYRHVAGYEELTETETPRSRR